MEYKGVEIHLTDNGEFYCDAVNNSNDYSKRQFNSFKFASIKKAIDDFEGAKVDKLFYKFEPYTCSIIEYKQVSSKGNLLIFDDGKDSNDYTKRNLISEDEINEDVLVFGRVYAKEMLRLIEKGKELELEKNKLRNKFKNLKFIK